MSLATRMIKPRDEEAQAAEPRADELRLLEAMLLETGWIRPRGRRKAPGRPVTYGTSETFLSHFGLDAVGDLPGLDELKGSGLLDGRLPPGFSVPMPSDDPALREDEDPLDPGDLDLGLAPPLERTGEA